MNLQEKLCILCLHILEEGEPYSELNKTNVLEDLKLVNQNFVKVEYMLCYVLFLTII